MKTKIINALIIKNFDQEPFFGEIVISDNKITFVGENSSEECDKVIDATGNIIMPGFVDVHTHAAMTLFKGLSSGKPLQDWLYDMLKLEKNLSGSDVYYGSALACLEFAKNGITTICDNYHFADYSSKAFADCGIRAVVGITQRYNLKKFLSEDETMELYTKVSNISDLITANFYCHAIYTSNDKMFETMNRLAQKTNSQVSTHASETLEEVGKCAKDNDDMSPIALLESYGFFDRNSLVFHATNVDANDINIFAKYGANVCANFGSNYKLASGVAPIYQMSKKGVNVCLGTDGSASNNRLDMFREMYLAATSQNILLSRPSCFLPKEILKMATVNGAKALGLDNVGTLEVGNFADLIMLDSHNVDALPDYDIFDNLVYSYGTEDVLMTMVNGKIVYQNGKYNFAKTKNAILSKAKEIKEKFLNK